MNIFISDQADEFRIELSGRFADSAVTDAAAAWQAALSVNISRRISVDITRMTGYDRAGYLLLRNMYAHGTNIAAGTPGSLLFLSEISSEKSASLPEGKSSAKRSSQRYAFNVPARATASGE